MPFTCPVDRATLTTQININQFDSLSGFYKGFIVYKKRDYKTALNRFMILNDYLIMILTEV
jgi:hypothetical protein